jgi:F-type H+-transporting ATPase subunit b
MLWAAPSFAQHAAEHGHAESAEAGHHEDHANAPPGEMNWYQGFLGTSKEQEPSVLWRRPDQPPPFLANIINFLIFGYVLVRFGKKPIQEALSKRKESIMKDMTAAQQMKTDAEQRLATYEEKLRHVDSEIERIRKEFREQGERERERIQKDAQEKREVMLKDAAFMIEQEAKQMRIDLTNETVEAAMKAAQQLLERSVTVGDHDRVAEAFLKNLATSKGVSPSQGGSA